MERTFHKEQDSFQLIINQIINPLIQSIIKLLLKIITKIHLVNYSIKSFNNDLFSNYIIEFENNLTFLSKNYFKFDIYLHTVFGNTE